MVDASSGLGVCSVYPKQHLNSDGSRFARGNLSKENPHQAICWEITPTRSNGNDAAGGDWVSAAHNRSLEPSSSYRSTRCGVQLGPEGKSNFSRSCGPNGVTGDQLFS